MAQNQAEAEGWFIHLNGEQRGPLSAAGIRQAMAQGALLPADWVWREGFEDWTQIQNLEAFVEAEASESAPPRQRWRIWKGLLLGFAASLLSAALNYGEFLPWLETPPTNDTLIETAGRLSAGPLIALVIVVLRNLIVLKRP